MSTNSQKFTSFVDRYFTRQYAVDVMKRTNEDYCILNHSNGISVLTLAPSHPIIQRGRESKLVVRSVDFKINEKVDRMENKVSGKSKRGAQFLVPDSAICRILCGENRDEVYTIRACVKGRLIEINERLINDPQLLVSKPETFGYICVILRQRSKSEDVDKLETGQESKNKFAISLIARDSYIRLRYPEYDPSMESVVVQQVDDCDD